MYLEYPQLGDLSPTVTRSLQPSGVDQLVLDIGLELLDKLKEAQYKNRIPAGSYAM